MIVLFKTETDAIWDAINLRNTMDGLTGRALYFEPRFEFECDEVHYAKAGYLLTVGPGLVVARIAIFAHWTAGDEPMKPSRFSWAEVHDTGPKGGEVKIHVPVSSPDGEALWPYMGNINDDR